MRNHYRGTARHVQQWTSGDVEQELTVGVDARYDDIGTAGLCHTQARQRFSTVDSVTCFYESQLPGETEPVADIHFHPIEPRQFRVTLRGAF